MTKKFGTNKVSAQILEPAAKSTNSTCDCPGTAKKNKHLDALLLSYLISIGTFIVITIIGLLLSRRWNWMIELIMPALVLGYVASMFFIPGFLRREGQKPVGQVLLA